MLTCHVAHKKVALGDPVRGDEGKDEDEDENEGNKPEEERSDGRVKGK